MALNGSADLQTEGNTSQSVNGAGARIAASKYWCFTSFEMNLQDLISEWAPGSGIKYIIGEENCPKTGKKHLQGFVGFPKKCRPLETWRHLKISHWEKCKGSEYQNVKYCSKNGNFVHQGIDQESFHMDENEIVVYLKNRKLKTYKKIVKEIFNLMFIEKRIKILSNEMAQKNFCNKMFYLASGVDNFNWAEKDPEEIVDSLVL